MNQLKCCPVEIDREIGSVTGNRLAVPRDSQIVGRKICPGIGNADPVPSTGDAGSVIVNGAADVSQM